MAHIPYGGDLIGSDPAFTARDLELFNQHVASGETISRFSSILSHALNNQLTVTMGYIERAQKLIDNPHQSRILDAAMQGATGMASALLQLQSFAAQESLESTSIDVALQDALELIRTKDGSVVINCIVDTPQRIDANYHEATRMFMSVLENSLESLGEHREISVRVRDITSQNHPLGISDGDYVVITVADTGCGIPPSFLPRIFEPFQSQKPNRTGMGLSWVWGFVRNTGGAIRVRSEVNKGTSMEIFLPLGVNNSRSSQPTNVIALRPNSTKRVLIVEDNVGILDIVHAAMTNLDCEVATAQNSTDARGLLEHNRYDLLITDVMLPGEIRGHDLAEIAVESHPLTKILLITGRLDRQNLVIRPDYHLLTKPFSMEKLTKTVKDILG